MNPANRLQRPAVDSRSIFLFCFSLFFFTVISTRLDGQACPAISCPTQGFVFVGAPNTETLLSTLTTASGPLATPTNALTVVQRVVICGTLVVDQNYTFNSSRIIMQDDASIRVIQPFTLTLKTCDVRGCTQMWETIRVESGARLEAITRTLIRDAREAISLQPNANLTVNGCAFERNLFCIRAMNTTAADLGVIQIQASDFDGSGALLETVFYNVDDDAWAEGSATHPLYAVQVRNVNNFTMGATTNLASALNLIHDYSVSPESPVAPYQQVTGVEAFNSNVTIRATRFVNIGTGGTPGHAGPEVGGKGVHFLSTTTTHLLRFIGIGAYAAKPTFDNCHRFIHDEQGRINLWYTWGRNCVIGVEASNIPQGIRHIVIRNCRIEQFQYQAIFVSAEAFPFGTLDMRDNRVVDNSEDDYFGSPRFGYIVRSNDVPTGVVQSSLLRDTFENANKTITPPFTAGFDLNRVFRIRMEHCRALNDETQSGGYNGVRVLHGGTHLLFKNHVLAGSAPAGGYASRGIIASEASNVWYSCNQLANAQQDFRFSVGCFPSDLTRNEIFSTQTTGLFLEASSIIGPQEGQVNTWPNTFGGTGEEAIWNLPNQDFSDPAIQGLLDMNEFAIFQPETTAPEQWASPRFPPLNFWFKDANGANVGACPTNTPQLPIDRISLPDERTLTDQFPAYMGYYGSIWDARLKLYTKLHLDPALRPASSAAASFYLAEQNTTLGQLARVLSGIRLLGEAPSPAFEATVLAKEQDVDTAIDELVAVEDQYYTATTFSTISALNAQRSAKLAQLSTKTSDYLQSLDTWKGEVATRLQNLNTALNAVTAVEIYEQNLKAVLAVSLEKLATAEVETVYTSTQKGVLQDIALQCRHEGGIAVSLARAMLEMDLGTDDFCEKKERSIGNGASQQPAQALEVFPNPANDALTVRMPGETPFDAIRLIDPLGKATFYRTGPTSVHTLDVGALPPGVYQLEVLSAGRSTAVKTFVIQH